MNIHYLQHVPFEGLGTIEEWALKHGHPLTATRFYNPRDFFPALEHFDLLVVMGGPMSVHDTADYSWLKGEKWFIKQAIDAGKPVLGICLGAQLIAEALGASVYTGKEKEIGWHPIRRDAAFAGHQLAEAFGEEMTVFHWHGETFDLPAGAQRIASSAVCENQGFLYSDRVLGLQFHLETTAYSAESIIENAREELVDAPYIQDEETILSQGPQHYGTIRRTMEAVLGYLAEKC